MYVPKHFQENDDSNVLTLIQQKVLGTLIVNDTDGLCANHLPFVAVETEGQLRGLQAHIPRANPLSRQADNEIDCLAIFQLADGYISPSWYATKREHGKVVPTWNYAVAHVHGTLRIIDEPQWVRSQLDRLTDLNERYMAQPWSVEDAPDQYIDQMIKALVGVEIEVRKIESKFKCSQNQPQANKQSLLDTIHKDQIAPALGSVMKPRITV